MKIRIETTDGDDEIVIKCRNPDERTELLRDVLESVIRQSGEMLLHVGGTEYYVDKSEILFFESGEGRVYAHTADEMYLTDYKLFELADVMPTYFVRISKSAVANVRLISSLTRELTGNGHIAFKNSDKIAYFSRAYYKHLKDRIEEVRFSK